MKLNIEDFSFTFAGRYKNMTQYDAQARARRAGATVYSGFSPNADVAVLGQCDEAMRERAEMMGLVIISEGQFMALLEGEVIDVNPHAYREMIDFDEAIAELRGMFDGVPDLERWTNICKVLDQTPEEVLEPAVAYVSAFASRWSRHRETRSFIPFKERIGIGPERWMYEMFQGQHNPKHELIRVLSFQLPSKKSTGKQVKTLLESSRLQDIQALDLGTSNRTSKALFQTVRTSEAMRGLQHLAIYDVAPSSSKGWTGEATFSELRSLSLGSNSQYFGLDDWNTTYGNVFQAECFHSIEELKLQISPYYGTHDIFTLLHNHLGNFPNLKHLYNCDAQVINSLATTQLPHVLEKLSLHLCSPWYQTYNADALSNVMVELSNLDSTSITTLDLSPMVLNLKHELLPMDNRYNLQDFIRTNCAAWTFLKMIDTLVLGEHLLTAEVRDELEEQHPNLTIL